MTEHDETPKTHKPSERRSEVCEASVGKSAALSFATIGVVALVVVLLLLT